MDRRSFLTRSSLALAAGVAVNAVPKFIPSAEAETSIDTGLISEVITAHAKTLANGTFVQYKASDWQNMHTATSAMSANLTAAGFNATVQRAVSAVPATKLNPNMFPYGKIIATVQANGQPGFNQAWMNWYMGRIPKTQEAIAYGLNLVKGYGPMPFIRNWVNNQQLMAGYLTNRFPGPTIPAPPHTPPKPGGVTSLTSGASPEMFMWPPATGGGEGRSGFTCADNNMAQAAVSAVLLVLGIMTWEVTGPIIVVTDAVLQGLTAMGFATAAYGLGSNVVCNFN